MDAGRSSLSPWARWDLCPKRRPADGGHPSPDIRKPYRPVHGLVIEDLLGNYVLTPRRGLRVLPYLKHTPHLRNLRQTLALVIYRRLIAMHWKAPVAPGIDLWRAELLRWAKAEAQTLQLLLTKGIPVKGLNTWNSFVTAIESKDGE
ncbi:hypothetical protein NDU88_003390 [Pleurodeles waltl]|uniref:Uncharacterized protein n=1 Tax=Pleurodeles waltl TaxID=8319 RepID=A0AAV7SFR2_PLEWA|nr:hypothetical protein NDU88_003390 [Pleurodeles waltl]